MLAKAKKEFTVMIARKQHTINEGQLLDFIPDEDRNDESGEIRLNGQYVCHNHSPYANEHFFILDEADSAHAEAILLDELTQKSLPELTPADLDWLLAQAKTAQYQQDWLNKISEADSNAFTLTDVRYWALLGLKRV